ncbi:hypothetical protein TKK_0001076 [Trichogramma kaykai]
MECTNKLIRSDVLQFLRDMREDIFYRKYIKNLGVFDFHVIYWSSKQVSNYNYLVKQLDYIEVIVIKNYFQPFYLLTYLVDDISFIGIGGLEKKFLFTQMISDNNSDNFEVLFTEWLKSKVHVPEAIIYDDSDFKEIIAIQNLSIDIVDYFQDLGDCSDQNFYDGSQDLNGCSHLCHTEGWFGQDGHTGSTGEVLSFEENRAIVQNDNIEADQHEVATLYTLWEKLQNHKVFVNGNKYKKLTHDNRLYQIKNTCPIDSLTEFFICLLKESQIIFENLFQMNQSRNGTELNVFKLILDYLQSDCSLEFFYKERLKYMLVVKESEKKEDYILKDLREIRCEHSISSLYKKLFDPICENTKTIICEECTNQTEEKFILITPDIQKLRDKGISGLQELIMDDLQDEFKDCSFCGNYASASLTKNNINPYNRH